MDETVKAEVLPVETGIGVLLRLFPCEGSALEKYPIKTQTIQQDLRTTGSMKQMTERGGAGEPAPAER